MENLQKDNLLEIRNLTVEIEKHSLPTAGKQRTKNLLKAVDDVSFSIKKGEILALAGESGCGKSMTALAIAGLLPKKAKVIQGHIKYKDSILTSMNEKQLCKIRGKEISIIFQEYRESLNPLMCAGDQIIEAQELVNGKDVKRQSNKRRVIEILHKLGFEDVKKIYNAYPHQLSGGMCQRVMAAIATIAQPKLLLADEPSTALDDASKELTLSLLAEINRNFGTSILVISHDLPTIRQFCSRYLIMYAGKIIEKGPASSLYSPLHPYTKALLGAIPSKEKKGSNLENIPGKVSSIEDKLTGCPFAPRCRKVQKLCMEAFPSALKFSNNRTVYCYYPENENGAINE